MTQGLHVNIDSGGVWSSSALVTRGGNTLKIKFFSLQNMNKLLSFSTSPCAAQMTWFFIFVEQNQKKKKPDLGQNVLIRLRICETNLKADG